MPLDLSTYDARRILAQGVKETDPDRKRKFREILQSHTLERIKAGHEPYEETHEEKATRWERTKKTFSGLKNYTNPDINPNPVFVGDAGRSQSLFAATSNIAWLAQTQGMEIEDAAKAYPFLRGQYAQQAYGAEKDPGDEGLYNLIKDGIDKETKTIDASNKAAQEAYVRALKTKPGSDWTGAYAEFKAENEGLIDPGDKESERRVMDVFRDSWKDSYGRTTKHRKIAKELLSQLQVTKDAEGNKIEPELSEDTLRRLVGGSKEDREKVYAILQAEAADGVIEKSFLGNLGTTLARSFKNIFGETGDANLRLHSDRLEKIRSALRSGKPVYQEGYGPPTLANVTTDDWRTGSLIRTDEKGNPLPRKRVTDPDKIKSITKQVGEAGEYLDVMDELRMIDQHVANPITPSNFVTKKILYPAADQIGFMASAPLTMGGATFLSVAHQRTQELRSRGVERGKAHWMGQLSAVVETPIEYFQFGNTARGVKLAGKFLAGAAPAKALAKNLGINLAVENAQEAVQDATNLMIQGVASKIYEDIDSPTKDDWKEYLGGRADTFWALLPFGMFGAGVATYRDFKGGKEMLSNRPALVASGVPLDRATEIVNTKDPEAATEILREVHANGEMNKPDPEAYDKALEDMAESVEGLTIDEETGAVTITDPETGVAMTFPDLESAQMGREDAKEIKIQETLADLSKVIKHFEGRGVEFAKDQLGKEATLQTKIDEGTLTTEEARQRVRDLAAEEGLALSHYDNTPFNEFPIHAESFFNEATGRFVVRMGQSGGVKAAIEDSAESTFKGWVREGYRTIDQYKEWIGAFQRNNAQVKAPKNPTGIKWKVPKGERDSFILIPEEELATATDKQVIEAMSSIAVGYGLRRRANYNFDRRLTTILRQLAQLWNHATRLGSRLIAQTKLGVLDPEFERAVSEAAGLTAPSRKKVFKDADKVARVNTSKEMLKSIEDEVKADRDVENQLANEDMLDLMNALLMAVKEDTPKPKKAKGTKPKPGTTFSISSHPDAAKLREDREEFLRIADMSDYEMEQEFGSMKAGQAAMDARTPETMTVVKMIDPDEESPFYASYLGNTGQVTSFLGDEASGGISEFRMREFDESPSNAEVQEVSYEFASRKAQKAIAIERITVESRGGDIDPSTVAPFEGSARTFSISTNKLFRDRLAKNTTAQEAIRTVGVFGTPAQRKLAPILAKAVPDNTTFRVLPVLTYTWDDGTVTKDIVGIHYPENNSIEMAEGYSDSVTTEGILHESVHAATQNTIVAVRDGREGVTAKQRAAVEKLERIREAFVKWGLPQMISEAGKKDSRYQEAYVFSSVEFPAWVLTNEELIQRYNLVVGEPAKMLETKVGDLIRNGELDHQVGEWLLDYLKFKKTEKIGEKSVIDHVVNLIKKILGVDTSPDLGQAVDAVMELLAVQAEFLENHRKQQAAADTTLAIGRPEIEPILNKATFIKNFNERTTRHVLSRLEKLDEKWDKILHEADLAGIPVKDTAEVTQALRQLDALLFLVPPALRGKVGGHVPLSLLRTDAPKARVLRIKLGAMERELKEYLKKQDIKKIKKLVKAGRPKKGTSTVGGPASDFANRIHNILKLSTSEATDKLIEVTSKLEGDLEGMSDADIATLEDLKFDLARYGALSSASYEHVVEVRDYIDQVITMGREERKAAEDKRREREKATRDALLAALPIEGTTSTAKARERKEATQGHLGKVVRNAVDFANIHMNFGQDLEIAFNGAKGIVKAILPKVRASTSQFTDKMIETGENFHRELGELWGLDKKRHVDKMLVDLHKGQLTGVSFDGVENQEMDQAEMINYTLIYGQERYRKNLESIGYTAEVNEQVEALLTKESIQLRAWLLGKYEEGYARLNAVYERINGAKLPKEKNYAPVSFTASDESGQLLDPFSNVRHQEFSAAFLRERVEHTKAPERNSALAVYWGHTVKAEYYTAWAETLQFLRGTLSHRDTRLAVKANSGTDMDRILRNWVEVFATNGAAKAEAHLADGRWFRRLRRTMAITGLAYNISSIMKQAPALVGFGASGLTLRESMEHSIKTLLAAPIGRAGIAEMWNDPIISRRIKGGHSIEARIATRSHGVGPNRLTEALEAGIKPLAYVDAGLTAFSAAVIKSALEARLSKDLVNTPEVKAQILRNALNEAVNSTAQPIELMDRSLVEINNQHGLNFMLLIFRSEPRQKLALLLRAVSNIRKGRDVEQNLSTIITVGVIMPTMIMVMGKIFAAYFKGDDEELTMDDWYHSLLASQWGGVAWFGEIVDAGLALTFGHTAFTRSDNKGLTGVADFVSAVNRGAIKFDASDPDGTIKGVKALANASAGLMGGNYAALPVGVRVAEYVRGFESPLTGDSLKERHERESKKTAEQVYEDLREGMTDLEYIIDRDTKVGDGSRAELIHRSLSRVGPEDREALRKRWVDMKLISSTVAKQLKDLK